MSTSLNPKYRLITGAMRDYQKDPLAFAANCAQQGSMIPMRLFFYHCIFISDPALIEEVLVTQHPNCIKPFFLHWPFMRQLIGNGLLTSEGEFWRRQRRLAQPAFHRERIHEYALTMRDYTAQKIASWQAGQMIDLHEEMMQLTLEIVAKTLFDGEVSDTAKKVGELLAIILKPFEAQATIKWFLHNYLPTPVNRRFHRAKQRLDEIIFKIINEHRTQPSNNDLLTMLLEARDEDGSQMTTKQLRDEVITLFIAGHETTALALTWTFYLLAQNPEVESRLTDELKNVLGGRAPTITDLPALKYAEKIMKEAIRLYPPVFAFGRETVTAFEIAGQRIPVKSQILIFPYVVHRDPRYFPDPEKFKPERWTEEFIRQLPRFAYLPFGGGPRVCIGISFAMTEALIILATIAQQYRLKLETQKFVKPTPSVSLRPEQEIKVIIENRV